MSDGTLSLVAANGVVLASSALQGGSLTTLRLAVPLLRAAVGTTSWSLSFTPPPATPTWTQTTPTAGSAGDSIVDDLGVTFVPGSSTDNRFFVERLLDANSPVLTLRGSVRLVDLAGAVHYGPYGTVTARWSVYSRASSSVAADGSWVITIPRLGYTPTIILDYSKNITDAAYDHAEAGQVNGQPMGVVSTRNQIIAIRVAPDGEGTDFNFVLQQMPPPPPPPVPSGELRLWLHSRFDPNNGVYRSSDQTVAWPLAEVADIAPAVDLAPLPAPPPGYRFEQRVVAWSYDGSLSQQAQASDALGRLGCRAGERPGSTAGDTSLLPGCVYAYHDSPSADQMQRQARLHWTIMPAPNLPDSVYAYRLSRFTSVDVQLSVLVETSVVNVSSGQRWTRRYPIHGSFVVKLVTPRTTK